MILPKTVKPWVQRTAAKYHYVWYVDVAGTYELAKQHDYAIAHIIYVVRNGMLTGAYDEHDLMSIGKRILSEHEKNSNYSKELIEKWEPLVAKHHKNCEELDVLDLAKLGNEELLQKYELFSRDYIVEYALPLLTEALGFFLETRLEKELTNHLRSLGRLNEKNEIMIALTAPTFESFLGREQVDLLLIAKKFLAGEDVSENIALHQKKWHWVQNDYYRSLVLDEKYFFTRAKKHAESKDEIEAQLASLQSREEAKKKKESLIKELELSKEVQVLLELSDIYAYWQDRRKEANVKAQTPIFSFLKEFSKRKNLDIDLLEQMTGDEVIAAFKKGSIDDEEDMKERINGIATIFTPSGDTFYTGEDVETLEKELESVPSKEAYSDVHGNVANMGKVRGRVKVVMNTGEFDKFEEGDVLVTSMTRPEFMPILKKAAAIVTNEGGLTCHAAIVSRELNIPCILGTKVATRVFSDGELVEVNANHGVVWRVKDD